MADRSFTLIDDRRLMTFDDLMAGIFEIISVLPANEFTFLVGLIFHATFGVNPRYKNPFALTYGQALSSGGGSSVKALDERQKNLRRFRHDGNPIVKIWKRRRKYSGVDIYQIQYEVLVPGTHIPNESIRPFPKTRSPRIVSWREIRRKVLERDGYQCQTCSATERLHVHHLTYAHEGRERMEELITLCASCHGKAKHD